jgi:flagellar biosynthesis/type III secretory pathway M-ring protein FliF/YscJ
MDVVKAQLDRIRQQLAGLTATQRMLVGTLVAVMVLTMLYWSKYAAVPDMVPVLDQSLNEDEIGRIDLALEGKGIPHSVAGGKVLVPADRKMEIVADLMYEQLLSRETQNAFIEMSKQLSPFSAQSTVDATYNQAKQMTLAQIIRRFPNVADAQVVINSQNERRIENSIVPTAMASITLRDPNQNPKQLIAAAADGIASAVAGLTPGHVSVIVNGKPHHVADSDNNIATGDELMDRKRESEEREEQKILSQFSYIPGITATVTCDVETRSVNERKKTYDGAIVKPLEEKNHNEESTAPAGAPAEPGVGANTGIALGGAAGAGGGGGSTTSTDDETKNMVLPNSTDTDTQSLPGAVTVRSATVRVPRSYFVSILKHGDPNAKEPDDASVQALAKSQLASIGDGVKKCVGLKADDQLSVDMYLDLPGAGGAGGIVMAASSSGASPASGNSSLTAVTAYGKEIGIGVLAVVSLFMMSSMVKKSTPAPVVAAPVVEEGPKVLIAGEGLVGEAGTTGATLAGMELDEETVNAQQMLEQVTTMVKENPDGAASLVKRWLNRS